MDGNKKLITMDEIRCRVKSNAHIVDVVAKEIGPVSLNAVARSVEMNWASFVNAVARGDQLRPESRGRRRRGKYSGVEALEILTETMAVKTPGEYADDLERVAAALRRLPG